MTVLVQLAKLALLMLIVVAAYTALLMLMEEKLIYYPDALGDWELPARSGGRVEDVHLTAGDGVRLHGWFFHGEDPAVTFLFFHGNAGNITGRADWATALASLPADVLLVDYRGYGKSEGRPGEEGLYLDAEAAYRHLIDDRGVPPDRIVVYGKSLGGAPACEVASRHPCKALIVQSSFTSAPGMAQVMYPFLPAYLLTRTRFASDEKVARIEAPKLFVHSTADEVIPSWMSEELHRKAREPKRLQLYDDGSLHNELTLNQRESLLALFRDFLGLPGR